MKKLYLLCLVILSLLIFNGCEPVERKYITVDNPSDVVKITINQNLHSGTKTVTTEDKQDILKITSYISSLGLKKFNQKFDEGTVGGGTYDITLLYKDNKRKTYIQKDNEYFAEEGMVWYRMNYYKAVEIEEWFNRLFIGFHLK